MQYYFSSNGWLAPICQPNGIEIIGDIPIYVAQDSSDVWSNPDDWQLDENLDPIRLRLSARCVCQTDSFGKSDYNYDKNGTGRFSVLDRIKESFKLYDIVRIDHFKPAYYAIPTATRPPTRYLGQRPGNETFQRVKTFWER